MQKRRDLYEKPSKHRFARGLPKILIIHSSHLISLGQLSVTPSLAQNSSYIRKPEKRGKYLIHITFGYKNLLKQMLEKEHTGKA